uniref:Uncharacterized protein n=1 Tax=Fundulus heteroclitus TaxID=8078 RepID=A0A3Q2QJJ6_FUNHE
VTAAVWQALNHYAYVDAVFLAERLYAEVRSEEALYLLATCYYRSGKPYKAYRLLKAHTCSTPQVRFLFWTFFFFFVSPDLFRSMDQVQNTVPGFP